MKFTTSVPSPTMVAIIGFLSVNPANWSSILQLSDEAYSWKFFLTLTLSRFKTYKAATLGTYSKFAIFRAFANIFHHLYLSEENEWHFHNFSRKFNNNIFVAIIYLFINIYFLIFKRKTEKLSLRREIDVFLAV